MKIIILSASTGGGHMSAANAIKEFFASKKVSAKVVDAIEYISPLLNKTVTEVYEYIAIKQPKLWKMMYGASNTKAVNKMVSGANSIISKKLLPLINESEPDVIISTHPFTTEMVSNLKAGGFVDVPLVCVMTDYAPHRTWTSPEVDAYVVANSGMVDSMADMDVDPKIIYPFGIPVDDSFYSRLDKKKVLEELSLDPSLPTILIMAGKGGLANIDKVYRSLQSIDLDFQIIIITGKNQKLYNRIKNLSERKRKSEDKLRTSHHRISKYLPKFRRLRLKIKSRQKKFKKTKVIYFTKEVEKYMNVSDLIITKPGGLTVSESLACGLPMALFNAIPGQEEENANFLVSNNMAVKLEKNISATIEELLRNPVRLQDMKSSCEKFDKSDSLKNIFELVKKLASKEKHFEKLVRDKIPEIITSNGNIPETEILTPALFGKYLKLKLIEEAKEVSEAGTHGDEIEELADLMEVFNAILKNSEITFEEVEKARKEKAEKRGGFEKRIFLRKVIFPEGKDED